MKKRGSHIGFILSFVIFVVFVFFLFTILEPITKAKKDKEATLEYLKLRLTEEMSGNLTTSSVILEKDKNKGCFYIDTLGWELKQNVVVKDEDENLVDSSYSESKLNINYVGGKKLYKIYSSEEILTGGESPSGTCTRLTEGTEYTIGLTKTEKQIFEGKIVAVKRRYDENYDTLKSDLKIPANNDFYFKLVYNDKNGNEQIIEPNSQENKPNSNTEVYGEELFVHYVDVEANLKPGKLIIQVW